MKRLKRRRNPIKPQKKPIVNIGTALVALALTLNLLMPCAYASDYKDVSDDAWYADAVAYVTEHGLMSGMGDGEFAPDQELTRAQIVELLYRLAGNPETMYTNQFHDVAYNDWYTEQYGYSKKDFVV